MIAYYRIRGIVVALFGAFAILIGVYGFGHDVVHGFSSEDWRFTNFGEVIGDPDPQFPPGIEGWILGTIWRTPYAILALVIGSGLLWQGLRAVAYAE